MPSSVYPTGTTIYEPEKCWNGYTVFQSNMSQGKRSRAVLISMNGNIVNQWKGLDGFPNKVLPGGYIMGNTAVRNARYGFQDMVDLVQVDWDGNVVWRFNKYERIKDPRQEPTWMARQHHDYQREGNTVGYYVPGMEPSVDTGNTIILCHKNLKNPQISEKRLMDDTIIEVNWDGSIVWEWVCSQHFDELGFGEAARNTMARNPSLRGTGKWQAGDWMHMNSVSILGPNKWYEQGDEHFHPDNLIWSGRQANIIGITDKKTGNIVWQLGPDYATTPALTKLGWIIGQHHAHMIPRGLPGEGNILLFDNGGAAGYGSPNPGSASGLQNALRDYSRVLEIDPTTFEVVWQCGSRGRPRARRGDPTQNIRIYSNFISSAQRLPNGNTLITEGSSGRIIEVTPSLELVWEYVSPYLNKRTRMPMVYRAYRLPYQWIPQVEKPVEKAIPRIDNSKFRVPGSLNKNALKTSTVKQK